MVLPSFTGETGLSPSTRTYRMRHVGEAAAGTDFDEALATVDIQGTVTSVKFIPDAAMTGATATATTFSLTNKTGPKTAATFAFITGQNLVAFAPFVLPVSGTAANVAVNAGDVLSFTKTHASTGTQGPSGALEVVVTRSDII